MTEEELTKSAIERGVPEGLIGGLVRYIIHGIQPGQFLTAVLSNDLMEAFGRADLESREAMFQIVLFLYNDAPGASFGSPERMAAWIKARVEERSKPKAP